MIVPQNRPFLDPTESAIHNLYPSSLAVAALSAPIMQVPEKGAGFEPSAKFIVAGWWVYQATKET